AFGLWPARRPVGGSGDRLERIQWRRIWLPVVPAALTLAVLIGWGLQEPNQTDELVRDEVGIAAACFAVVWLRALVRALRALARVAGSARAGARRRGAQSRRRWRRPGGGGAGGGPSGKPARVLHVRCAGGRGRVARAAHCASAGAARAGRSVAAASGPARGS